MPKKAQASNTENKLKVTLIKSISGRLKAHQDCIHGLGLRRLHHTVQIADNACNRGMINKVSYLLKVESA